MTTLASAPATDLSALARGPRGRAPRIGLVTGGLGAYWPQFPQLRPTLERSAARIAKRLGGLGADVVDVGLVSDETEARAAAERLRVVGCDLVCAFVATYMTATMMVPIGQRAGAPVLFVNLQPSEAMDHEAIDTGGWLAYCGACPLPELANAFERCGLRFRSVSGHLEDERAWARIADIAAAAGVRAALADGRHGLLGHLYPGMLDVSTDLTHVPAQLGGHVEVLEIDDLRVRVPEADDPAVGDVLGRVRERFEVTGSVDPADLAWAARVAAGLDRLAADYRLDTLAYYHRGLGGDLTERIGAGMILGASLLTARGLPAAGEFELRTSLAMLVLDRLGAGGSFTELQALDFRRGVVEMGHDGPGHLGIAHGRPLLRGLGVFHGKRGFGVSVEFDVRHGPVTLLGLTQRRDGRLALVTSEGTVVDGTRMRIGNTTSLVSFDRDPGEWTDAWASTAVAHHWALGVGHLRPRLRAVAELLDVELVEV